MPVSGGSINQAFQLTNADGRHFFCKQNSATLFPQLFRTEAQSLQFLSDQKIIRVPNVEQVFEEDGQQFLLLEWIDSGTRTKAFWKSFGAALAQLHQVRHSSSGFDYDNYMGSVPQRNTKENSWIQFFVHHRLQPMITRCTERQLLTTEVQNNFEKIIAKLPQIFDEKEPSSLIHGDLWSGNFMCDDQSMPVLIDPAIYFGHRSMDIGMTHLFGGFDTGFYEAYHFHFPMPKNGEEQYKTSNLYPLLIHLFLFGKSYLSSIQNTLRAFV